MEEGRVEALWLKEHKRTWLKCKAILYFHMKYKTLSCKARCVE